MERLLMCRICLLKNVRLYLIANQNLQDIYKKLTNIPLETEDSRPMFACSICYVKLEQCYRLQRNCLEAEKLFALMLNEGYQYSQGQRELYGGFVITPVQSISIGDDVGIEIVAIKQEPIFEEPFEAELKVEGINDLKSENLEVCDSDLKADSEDDLPLMRNRDEVQEEKEAVIGTESAPIPKKSSILDLEILKQEDTIPVQRDDTMPVQPLNTIPVQQKKNVLSDERVIQRSTQFTDPIPIGNLNIKNGDTARNIEEATKYLIKDESKPKHEKIDSKMPYKCDICSQVFKTKDYIKRHISLHTQEQPYKCNICSRGFKTKKYLKRHLFIHSGILPYKCDICKKSYARKNYLVSHIRLHTGEKPYKCDICQKRFTSQSNFKSHCRRHAEPETRFGCEICEKNFSQRQHLNIHMRLHTDEKPYKCDICKRSFVSKSHLKVHSSTHTGIKPYKCDTCQKNFVYKSQLKLHMWTHIANRPHKCHLCEKSFVAKSTLKIHIRTHTGEKPYRCDNCSRDFNRVNSLNRHICKGRPMPPNNDSCKTKCDICQNGFSKMKDLIYHYGSVHPEVKPYKCTLCSRCYGSRGGLNKHMRSTH